MPSAESVALSKAILMDTGANQQSKVHMVTNIASKDRSSLAGSAEKERRPGGGSLVIPSSAQHGAMGSKNATEGNNRQLSKDGNSSVGASPISEKRTPGAKSEIQATSSQKK